MRNPFQWLATVITTHPLAVAGVTIVLFPPVALFGVTLVTMETGTDTYVDENTPAASPLFPSPLLEQPGLFWLEIRQDMTVIIEPPGNRIAPEYHEFPDVGGIGSLVITHEDLPCSLSYDLNLAGSM